MSVSSSMLRDKNIHESLKQPRSDRCRKIMSNSPIRLSTQSCDFKNLKIKIIDRKKEHRINKDNQVVSTIKPLESNNNYKGQTVPGIKPSQEW